MNELKTNAEQIVSSLCNLYSVNDWGELPNLEGVQKTLYKPFVKIGVLGQTNSGKSTLLNCFLKSDLLPTSTLPNTNFLTEIVSNDENNIIVNNKENDGCIREQSKSELQKILREIENDKTSITNLRINHTTPFHEHVFLYDTPGLGDLEHWRSELTIDFVKEVDVVIFLFKHPINHDIIEFLRKQTELEDLKKVFFVMSHIDIDDIEDHIVRIVKSNSESITASLSIHPKIYTFNLKRTLSETIESNSYPNQLLELINDINSFLSSDEKDKISLLRCMYFYLSKIHETLQTLSSKHSMISLEDKELIKLFDHKESQLIKQKSEVTVLSDQIFNDIRTIGEKLDEELNKFRFELKDELNIKFNGFSSGINQFLNSAIFPTINQRIKDWEKESKSQLLKIYEEIINKTRKKSFQITSVQTNIQRKQNGVHHYNTMEISELSDKYLISEPNTLVPLVLGGGVLALITGTVAFAFIPLFVEKIFKITEKKEKIELEKLIPSIFDEIDFLCDKLKKNLHDKLDGLKIDVSEYLVQNLEQKIEIAKDEIDSLRKSDEAQKLIDYNYKSDLEKHINDLEAFENLILKLIKDWTKI